MDSRRFNTAAEPGTGHIRNASLTLVVSVSGKRVFEGQRQKPKKAAQRQLRFLRDQARARQPRQSGAIRANLREISANLGLRGGGGSRYLTRLRPAFSLLDGKLQGILCDWGLEQPI
jgi:hypothetical protein